MAFESIHLKVLLHLFSLSMYLQVFLYFLCISLVFLLCIFIFSPSTFSYSSRKTIINDHCTLEDCNLHSYVYYICFKWETWDLSSIDGGTNFKELITKFEARCSKEQGLGELHCCDRLFILLWIFLAWLFSAVK